MCFFKRLSLLFLILCTWASITCAALTTQIKPDAVQLGETFNLIITSDEQQSPIPNLTPLQKDFRIVGTERTMNYMVTNGQARTIHQLIVHLMPKRQGKLTLPALSIGQQKTKATTIKVSKAEITPQTQTTSPVRDQDDVMLKTEVSNQTPYVNQQIIYSVKLYNSGRLLDAEYQPPNVENALLIPLGDTDRYQTMEGERSYVVEEQRYAVFPQKSGSLTITGPSFNALVYEDRPRRINIPPKKTSLNVKPMPANFKGKQWLPTRKLSLSESYDQTNNKVDQGTTLTRIINLKALEVPAQLLPSIELKESHEFNVYSDKPELNNVIRQHQLVGQKKVKITYLLNQSGKITIPEFNLVWFDTASGKTAIAKLPPRTIEVTANATQSDASPAATASNIEKTKPETTAQSIPVEERSPLPWLLAIGFALAWLLTLLLWWIKPDFKIGNKKRQALKRLREACTHNNPAKAREALLYWASLNWPSVKFLDLNDIEKQVHDVKLKNQLNKLSKVLYSANNMSKWQGNDLWLAVTTFSKKPSSRRKAHSDLPPINP